MQTWQTRFFTLQSQNVAESLIYETEEKTFRSWLEDIVISPHRLESWNGSSHCYGRCGGVTDSPDDRSDVSATHA